jgi:hypothetical protein
MLIVILLLVVFECNHIIKTIDAWVYITIANTVFNHPSRRRILGGEVSRCCMLSTHDPKMANLENYNTTNDKVMNDVSANHDNSVVNVNYHYDSNTNTGTSNDALQNNIAAVSLLRPSSLCNVDQMSGTDLAYIGDVVYELYIRSRTVWPLKRTSDLQQQVVAYVRGKYYKREKKL